MANEAVRIPIEAVDNTKAAFNSVNQNLNKTAKNANVVSGAFRGARGATQQLGFQIQDVAVQLQSGTAASTVFAQQGSQIASIFGPGGAVIGAFLAVGAAIAGPLISSLRESSGLIDELRKNAEDSVGSLNKLSGAAKAVALAVAEARLEKAQEALTQETENLTRAQDTLAEKSLVKTRGGVNQNVAAFERANEEVKKFTLNQGLAQQEVDRLTKAISDANDPLFEQKVLLSEQNEMLEKANATLLEQIATYGEGAGAVARYRANLDGELTTLELINIARSDQLDLLRQEEEEKRNRQRLDKEIASGEISAGNMFAQMDLDRLKAIKKERKEKEDAKNAVLSNLDDQLAASAQNSKKMFAVNKAFRIAQATMQTYEAATKALAAFPPPFGQLAAIATVGFGLGQVANIKSQSFEGGGFTGRGARAGGLDGKGGRMAMIHPNETVIDHTKGGAGGITVINNVDARGSGADVDQKIKFAMAQSSQQTIMTIQDLMRRRRFV